MMYVIVLFMFCRNFIPFSNKMQKDSEEEVCNGLSNFIYRRNSLIPLTSPDYPTCNQV